ncbi:hypothetical protein FSP39_003772 [Pinctada imbricata]|uniref:Uncharacterized protein n=1 Tax=Pinctada imbricata TaxID=66713 RepID=A0AA89C0N8_PINIB|nr:hypothetical protein FSP39_003772 [Pinctada imbricata]
MRDNLIFDWIPESNEEKCEEVLTKFIADEMGLTEIVNLERVHRMGRHVAGKHRPIVAKFSSFKQKETVRRAAPRTLKGKPFGVNEQFPKEITERRKILIPHLKAAKRQQKKAFLKVDKLYINDRLFIPDDGASGETLTQTARNGDRNMNFPTNARTSSKR